MNLIKKLQSKFDDKREIIDLNTFNDPLVFSIDWTPLSGGSFNTHRIKKESTFTKDRLILRATLASYIFYLIFTAINILVIFGSRYNFSFYTFIPITLSILGCYFIRDLKKYDIIFDKNLGTYKKFKKDYLISEIHAIQLIREYVRTANSSYYSYQLNLVLHNSERIIVTEKDSLKIIREDAVKLAKFIDVPIWDIIDYRMPKL